MFDFEYLDEIDAHASSVRVSIPDIAENEPVPNVSDWDQDPSAAAACLLKEMRSGQLPDATPEAFQAHLQAERREREHLAEAEGQGVAEVEGAQPEELGPAGAATVTQDTTALTPDASVTIPAVPALPA